jgi:hypothetical protein
MSVVDRNILRLAVAELLVGEEPEPVIIINEALETARRFSGEESVRFINGSVTFAVTAIGSQPLRYEWKHGVDTIASATGPTLLLSDLQPADGGDYTVLVSNQYGTNPATATLTALVGAMLLLARLMRLGFVANFISEPVLIGFKAGVALVIASGQLFHLLGIEAPSGGFFTRTAYLVGHLGSTHLPSALVGIGAFILYFVTNLLVMYGSRIREYYADRGSTELGNQPHQLASALYKLSQASLRPRSKEEMKRVEAVKAFFVADPARASMEVRELAQIDRRLFESHGCCPQTLMEPVNCSFATGRCHNAYPNTGKK